MFLLKLFNSNSIHYLQSSSVSSFCGDTYTIWQFAGKIVNIFKILIPVILIIVGLIGLGKALVANEDDEIKKASNSLLKKIITGLAIFFLPTLINAIVGMVDSDVKRDATICIECITNPNDASKCNSGKKKTLIGDLIDKVKGKIP
ncbi:MAG: hypothetical protein GX951_02120 [Mollicutes bacterium]|nr:hypothetical protein [Mollicutes bacterium]